MVTTRHLLSLVLDQVLCADLCAFDDLDFVLARYGTARGGEWRGV